MHSLIDIEELNSGLYVLKRLSSALQADHIHASSFLNPKNTLAVNQHKNSCESKHKSDPLRVQSENLYAREELKKIINTTKQELSLIIPQQIALLCESFPELIIFQDILKTYIQQRKDNNVDVFAALPSLSDVDILNCIQTQYAAEEDALVAYQDDAKGVQERASEYFNHEIKPHLHAYMQKVSHSILSMLMQIKAIAPAAIAAPTPENIDTVNGQTVLQAMLSGVQALVQKYPELSSNTDVTTILGMASYLSQPTLTAQQLQAIYAASDKPNTNTLCDAVDRRDIAAYKEGVTQAYQTCINNLTAVRLDVSDSQKLVDEELSAFQQVEACFENFVKGVSRLSSLGTSQDIYYARLQEYLEMYACLTSLSQAYSSLTTEAKNIIKPLVEQFQQVTLVNGGSGNKSVNSMMGAVAKYLEVADLCLQNTYTQTSAIIPHLTQRGNALKTKPFFLFIGGVVASASDATLSPNYIKQGAAGNQVPNYENFTQKVLDANLDNGAVAAANNILTQFQAKAAPYKLQLQTKSQELSKKYDSLDPGLASFSDNREAAVQDWLKSESLGSALVFMIQNSQLPKQKTMLAPLIKEVNFNNMAANAINDLLLVTNAFSTSTVYYNLSSFLIESKEGKDLFNGDFFETSTALAKEREQISRDQGRCKRAQELVDALLKKIQQMPDVSEAQRTRMLNATRMYEQFLSITLDQLVALDSLLVNLTITPEKDSNTSKYRTDVFKITGPQKWIPALANLEGFIANGYPDSNPSGGLGPLFTLIQSDQQEYTTQGQTQQLNLQNQMTNVQQEWTLVSTSMQVLNKILSLLAGEIK